MGMTMPQTVQEYLRCIEPVYQKRNGRWVIGSESRQRTYAAVKEVLLAGGGVADYRVAVALAVKAAPRHGAEIKAVWRHIRRYRDLSRDQAEQLKLPI
jgi:hypothetical protein